jgi:hypothetical protein
MIPAGAHDRLAAHVDAVLARASIPSRDRQDLTEELLGHLIEHCEKLIAAGVEPGAAADRAISEFGAAPHIGRELTRAYRGRLWASTIGPLLPDRARPARPLAITLLAVQAFALSALYVGSAGWTLVNHSPLHAVLLGLGGAAVSAALLLVGFGLLQGQRWAVLLATLGSVLLVFDGAFQLTRHTASLSAVLAGASLLALVLTSDRVHRWLSPIRPPRSTGVVGLLLILPLAAPIVERIPDPTLAAPDDLELAVTVDCAATVEVWADRARVAEPGIVIHVDVRWTRTSLLPAGVANAIPADNVVVSLPDEWVLQEDRLFDLLTGEEVPGSGGIGPGGPPEVEGPAWFAAIPREELWSGRTVRFELTLADGWIGPRTLPLPREPIVVRYWHADVFSVERSATCKI